MRPAKIGTRSDLELAGAVAAGSLDAWHEFVLRYSALILSTVRRYMPGFEVDDHRNVYVDILKRLLHGALRQYDGTVTLASWVIVVSRNRSLDALRTHHGRKRLPAWLRRLPALEQEVYRLFYVEGQDAEAVAAHLARSQPGTTAGSVEAALDHLDTHMSPRLRTQLAYELQARSAAGATSRLLEFMNELRRQNTDAQERLRPDAALRQGEAQAMLSRIQAQVERLPADERRAIELFYWGGLRADAVAGHMGLANGQRARSLLRSAVNRLRRTFRLTDPRGDGAMRIADEFPRCSFHRGEP